MKVPRNNEEHTFVKDTFHVRQIALSCEYRNGLKGTLHILHLPQGEHMRRIGNRLAAPLFALLLAASLAFGVTTSFAQAERPASRLACENNGDDLLGSCSGFALPCDFRCQQNGYIGGDCIGGIGGDDCCVCRR
jgi:hypothetical protein